MQITFLGAAQQVTGSCYLVQANGCRFLIDCGMVQGSTEARERNYAAFAFDPREIDFVLLTHAHIDHSGLLPRLVAQGFAGPIYTTPATADLLSVLLRDSAHIQEVDYIRALKRAPKGRHKAGHAGKHAGRQQEQRHGAKSYEPSLREPLYTVPDVVRCLALISSHKYDHEFAPHPQVKVRFSDAGHILGSAIVEIWLTAPDGSVKKLVTSGDLGQPGRVILRDPSRIANADVLLIESTYGDRLHKDMDSTLDELVDVVSRTLPRGNVVIPAFAVGRTQELLYYFLQLARQQRLSGVNVFVDSPMAVSATEITFRHFETFDEDALALLSQSQKQLAWPHIHFISEVEDSKKLNQIESGAVIISASGMCDAGRVLHHLYNNLGRSECAVVIAGFQAEGTLGRRLVDGDKQVRLLGDDVRVRASVHTLGGFSAHADQKALLDWASGFEPAPARTYVVHGEPPASQALAAELRQLKGWQRSKVLVPEIGAVFPL